jgi:putative salt-induced outer membrane protein
MQSVALLGAALAICGIASAAAGTTSATQDNASTAHRKGRAHSKWATHGEIGFVMARGVTTTKSGDVKLSAAHRLGRWTYSGGFTALYASTDHVTTQQDMNGRLQVDMALSKRTFWFTGLNYDRNLFDGFAYQESAASGLGRVLMETNQTHLSIELGAGYRRELPEALVLNSFGGVKSLTRGSVVGDAVLHAVMKFAYSFSSSTKLLNSLLVESGASDTMTMDNLSLQVKMDTTLALSVGLQATNNTNPSLGNAPHTNTVMTLNLVYQFKTKNLSPGPPMHSLLDSFDVP